MYRILPKKPNVNQFSIMLIILGSLFFQGCFLPMGYKRTYNGIDTMEMINYMNKKNIDTTNAVYFSLSGFRNAVHHGYNKILTIAIFDKDGKQYSVYPESVNCQRYNKQFFSNEFEFEHWRIVENNVLLSILENDSSLINLKDEKFSGIHSVLEKADYTVIIFWSVHLSQSKRVKDWQSRINENDRFQYVTINLDVHSSWDVSSYENE